MRAGLSCASRAPVTASIVPGAMSWPCSISSTVSSTTVAAVCTSPSAPSRGRTLPRGGRPHSRGPRSVRSPRSSDPASSAATVLSRVSCLRAKLLAHRLAHPLAVRPAPDLGHQRRHHLAHLLLLGGAALLDRRGDQVAELLIGELLGKVGLDQLGLA